LIFSAAGYVSDDGVMTKLCLLFKYPTTFLNPLEILGAFVYLFSADAMGESFFERTISASAPHEFGKTKGPCLMAILTWFVE